VALTTEQLKPILRAAWGSDTCDPHDLEDWRPDNPARGQCGVTALVDHYWNRLPDGRDIDFTADQFDPAEVVSGGQVQHRPPNAPVWCREQYELLRRRVLAALPASRRG